MAEITGCIEMMKVKYSVPSPSKRLVKRRAADRHRGPGELFAANMHVLLLSRTESVC